MKRQDATTLPELTAWIGGLSTGSHERFAIADPAAQLLTVYLDATIIERFSGWRQKLQGHLLYVSDIALAESGLPMLHANDRTRELAAQICRECGLPGSAFDDAHHLAIAAIHRMKVLLTLNAVYLADAKMISLIERACEARGYAPPRILTPEQLDKKETGR